MYLYGSVLSKKINESGTGDEVVLDGRRMKWGNFLEFEGMTGKIVLGDEGVRQTIYKFSTYEGTEGQVRPYAMFAVTDGGVTETETRTETRLMTETET
ncbi:hypothetical protein AAVH_16091 [Aphelenchoides avenae]|nr:hypothetical protein AAVH_16091 [Aphelenchus avenae]